MRIPTLPDDPTLLREPDGTRFTETPVSFLLIATYGGRPTMLLTWLVRAMAEREDRGLGLPPRTVDVLAATAGLTREEFERCTEQFIADGWLTRWADGSIRIPWGRIYETSVQQALEWKSYVTTLRERAHHERMVAMSLPLDLT